MPICLVDKLRLFRCGCQRTIKV